MDADATHRGVVEAPVPLDPPDVLERATLRQVSVAVRKMGNGQGALSAFNAGEGSSGPLSNIHPLDSQA